MAQLIATKPEKVQGILDFVAAMQCADCSPTIRERTNLSLTNLMQWWLVDIAAITGIKPSIEARPSEKFPKSGGSITFLAEMPIRKAAVPVIQLTFQHESSAVHEQLQVPHAFFLRSVAEAPNMAAAEPLIEAFEQQMDRFRNRGEKTKSIPLKSMNLDQIGRPIRDAVQAILESLAAACMA